ncbi:hypothetical protein B0H14DRAFT_2594360 [Mycena olivaceomarginata]|nr:hypothetical protein B0H14DRAFT_2594360 [Mycena olivaceomarginata]
MCRKCKVDGTEKNKAIDTCFHSLFEPGIPRLEEKILAEHKKQVKLAQFKEKKGQRPPRSNTEIEEELVQWTLDNEDKIYSGFFTLKGFDPTKDTPVEILLGVVKYIWHSSHTSWNTSQKETYSQRLQSTNTDGLSIHAIRANYIMQYANSLIGRQFKTIAQTKVFHVHGLVTDAQFATWWAVGKLLALLWFTEIRNLKEYCNDVRIGTGNVLDAFAVVNPTKIITKIKLHLLAHLPEDITAFGPLVGVMTEIYECFNAVFRPRRTEAPTDGWLVAIKETAGEWEQAGPAVHAFLHTCPVLQKLVGWTVGNPPVPDAAIGSVKLVPLPKRKKGSPAPQLIRVQLSATHAAQALNSTNYDMSTTWFPCKQVIKKNKAVKSTKKANISGKSRWKTPRSQTLPAIPNPMVLIPMAKSTQEAEKNTEGTRFGLGLQPEEQGQQVNKLQREVPTDHRELVELLQDLL